jgi:hypothetical protein
MSAPATAEAETKDSACGSFAPGRRNGPALLREAFTRHGGVEVETQGDPLFYPFGDANDAVAAAEAGQAALPRAPYGFAWLPLSSLALSHAPATLGRHCSLRSSVRTIRSSSKEDSGHMRRICDGVLPGDER